MAYAELGDVDNAEQALRLAVDSGEVVAANDLAILLRDTDRLAEALHVLRHAAEDGDEQAPANLVGAAPGGGRRSSRPPRRRRGTPTSRDRTRSWRSATCGLRRASPRPRRQAYRRAIELGGVRAHTAYGLFLLTAYGDASGAEEQFRVAWRHNEPGWPYMLGRFLVDDGRPEEAREFLEAAAGWGDRDGRPTCWTRSTASTPPTTSR